MKYVSSAGVIETYRQSAYFATGSEGFILVVVAVIRDNLLYWLRIINVARVIGVILGFNIRDGGTLALAGEYGRCIEGGCLRSALLGTHGWGSLCDS